MSIIQSKETLGQVPQPGLGLMPTGYQGQAAFRTWTIQSSPGGPMNGITSLGLRLITALRLPSSHLLFTLAMPGMETEAKATPNFEVTTHPHDPLHPIRRNR